MRTFRLKGQIYLMVDDISHGLRQVWVGESKKVDALRTSIDNGTWVQQENHLSSKSLRRKWRKTDV